MVARMHPASKRTSGYRLLPTIVSTAIIKSHRAQTARLSQIRELSSFFFFSSPSLSLSSTCFTRTYFFSSSPYTSVDFLHITMSSGKGFHERDQRYTSNDLLCTVPFSPFTGGPVSFLFATPFSFLPCSTSSSSSCSCSAPSSWVPLRPLLLLLLLFRNGDAGFPLRVQPEPSEAAYSLPRRWASLHYRC